ncbi:hypothetical protein GQ457_06G009080 [Hibiscus cannabinus]
MIEQRFDDFWEFRLGLISQSKLESKWLWILPYLGEGKEARGINNGEGIPYLGSVLDSFDVDMLYFTLWLS